MDNPRIWSLWDIMNEFNVTGFAFVMHELSRAKLAFTMQENFANASLKPEGASADIMVRMLNDYSGIFPEDMTGCVIACKAAKAQWDDKLLGTL